MLKLKEIAEISRKSSIDEEKIGAILDKLLKLINKSKLTIPELLILVGNLSYFIGASIAGLKETGPSLEELKKHYYKNPTVDVALMLQGLEITSWEEDFVKHPKISNLGEERKE